jgi:phosphoenolpyruvate---glycerone phosphotransferase subunit DhaK
MKKLMNTADSFLRDALTGMAAAHPLLRVDLDGRLITRADSPRAGKVALVSGGGSGHEPLHGGFVGTGMLDAACPGEVFTSPVPDQMVAAAKAVNGGAGVVFIVKNYTGDVMNFQMAADIVSDEGVAVETILVDDDVAVENSTWTAGRRGTGATVFVEKIAGALAEQGAELKAVAEMGRRVNEASRSFAVALTSCTTPMAGKPGFDLPDDEIEVGVGIHGEPGRRREKIAPVHEIVTTAMEAILGDQALTSSDQTIVMVNGLGASPLIELYVVFNEVAAYLAEKGIRVSRSLVGNYVTSLDMAGVSITIAKADESMLALWDAPVHTSALRWGV